MRAKTLLILVAALLVVGGYVYFWERHQLSTDEAEERAEKVLPDLAADAVAAVEIQDGPDIVRLERTGDDGWRLTRPLEAAADGSKVSTLLTSLGNLSAERRVSTTEVEPAAYALDAPDFVVRLEDGSGAVTELAVGDETPLGSDRALRVDQGLEILFAPGWFVTDLERPVEDWRSRDVVDLFADQVASLDVRTADDRIRVVRLDDQWQLLEPLEDLADPDHLRNLISDLNALRVEEFVDEAPDLEALGLVDPGWEITVVRADGGDPVQLELGAEREVEGQIQVACRRGDGAFFWVDDRPLVRLGKAPVRWRAPEVWPFDTWAVDRLTLAEGDAEITVDRADGVWSTANGEPVDYGAVQERLGALASLEAVAFDLTGPVTDQIGRVVLGTDAGDDGEPAETVEMRFFAPLTEGGDVMVTVSDRETVMAVSRDEVTSILSDPGSLRAENEVATGDEPETG